MLKKGLIFLTLLFILLQLPLAKADEGLKMAAAAVIENLAGGQYSIVYKQFDGVMKGALPLKALQGTWESVLLQFGSYRGQLATRSEMQQGYTVIYITCEFEKEILDFVIPYNSQKEISGLQILPGTAPRQEDQLYPEWLREKELTIVSGEWSLPAGLTLPASPGVYPLVILVHGSGPQDKDETIGPNKPFRDLAWGLAKEGIAVLRYDKRTKVYGGFAFATDVTVQEETIDDVLAAIEMIKEQEGVNNEQIFILGHSLGGMLLPRIAAQSNDIRGLIALAGSARPMEDLIWEQTVYLLSLEETMSKKEKEKHLDALKIQIALVKSNDLTESTPSAKLPLEVPASYWLDLRDYDPLVMAKEIDLPFLFLQGGRDYQVTVEDFELWRSALIGRKDVEFILYPDLNHLFGKGEGKSKPEEYELPAEVDQAVIADIAAWLKKIIK